MGGIPQTAGVRISQPPYERGSAPQVFDEIMVDPAVAFHLCCSVSAVYPAIRLHYVYRQHGDKLLISGADALSYNISGTHHHGEKNVRKKSTKESNG